MRRTERTNCRRHVAASQRLSNLASLPVPAYALLRRHQKTITQRRCATRPLTSTYARLMLGTLFSLPAVAATVTIIMMSWKRVIVCYLSLQPGNSALDCLSYFCLIYFHFCVTVASHVSQPQKRNYRAHNSEFF